MLASPARRLGFAVRDDAPERLRAPTLLRLADREVVFLVLRGTVGLT